MKSARGATLLEVLIAAALMAALVAAMLPLIIDAEALGIEATAHEAGPAPIFTRDDLEMIRTSAEELAEELGPGESAPLTTPLIMNESDRPIPAFVLRSDSGGSAWLVVDRGDQPSFCHIRLPESGEAP